MKIAIIGFAREGQAAFVHWNRDQNEITICDRDEKVEAPRGVSTQFGPDYLQDLDRFDVIVRTAGLHPDNIAKANPEAPNILEKVTTSVNEFLRVCPSRNIIGVTGTKGKGTTSVLITKMLEAAGYTTHLGGNIGIPPLKLLQEKIDPEDWVVLELSSFQLMDIKSSPHIAVCVMMAEEHINWHQDYSEYIAAKQQLFKWQKADDIAIYYGPDAESKKVVSLSAGKQIPYMQAPGAEVLEDERIVIDGEPICHVSEIKLLGKHNWQNICAAATAVWQVTHDIAALHKAVTTLESLPHRLEPVGEVRGVRYFNDSFASAPGSVVAALDAVAGPKVLIVGGLEKRLDLSELADAIVSHQKNLTKVIIIGTVGPRLVRELQKRHFDNFDLLKDVTMLDIVAQAQNAAKVGDAVLFSPGSSSFDMFKDFFDRGEQFKEAVRAL